MPDHVRAEAPAKVNLRLRILAREASGYHALESIFCAVSLSDSLEVRRGEPGVRLRVEGGVETGPPELNLVVRAAHRFYSGLDRVPGLDLRLEKRIPSAAGLGGGSSDAAAALRALNALEGEPFEGRELLQMAIELGADVPFFLCGSPLALGWSRGERLLALPPLPPRPVLVAHPGEAVSTAEAFRALAASRPREWAARAESMPLEALASWARVAALQGNDFQPGVVERIPRLQPALEALRSHRARVALLAGSGGCVFGVFDSAASRDAARTVVEALGLACWSCETLDSMPLPRVDPADGDG